ncbi:hypothetical protein THRCLA_22519 [Thraustotheca clavata]|uniref:Uncharacterized protein n=1 Tax=Thraustotheca clavata TaxID=74557 RepID=A0A1V9YYA4_9STRA|nr:hypothetical protein THRCLA_22519 [Thraustotheca clavata]
MNPLLLLYLNLVRGPQIAAERAQKEAEEKAKLDAANPKPLVKEKEEEVPKGTCKKCDKEVAVAELHANYNDLCYQCANNPISLLSPLFIFQLISILIALSIFLYRNFM